MKTKILASSFLLMATSTSAAVLDFHFSDQTDTAVGKLTTDSTTYPMTITEVRGTFDGVLINGLSTYALADNKIYYYSPWYFSLGGFSFSAGGVDYNIYAYNGGDYILNSRQYPAGYAFLGTLLSTATVTSVPEPTSWALMLVGVLGLGAALRRRSQAVTTPDQQPVASSNRWPAPSTRQAREVEDQPRLTRLGQRCRLMTNRPTAMSATQAGDAEGRF